MNIPIDRARDGRARARRRRAMPAVAAVLAGVILAYLLARRDRAGRRIGRERMVTAARRSARRGTRAARVRALRTRGRARGTLHRLRRAPRIELDDVELAHKVETIVFRDPRVPKGRLSINAEDGVVFVRGEVESAATVEDVERAVAAVPGVRDVQNLLHLPGTPAPHPPAGAHLR